MTEYPFISVIVPVYNEEKYLDNLIRNFLSQDYPKDQMEWIFIDGASTDNTLNLLHKYKSEISCIEIIENPNRYVSYALNMAIGKARGEYIIRMDAHSIYPTNYWSTLIRKSKEYGADNVGGVWVTKPGDDSILASAIVYATSHPVGIGNARYRLGSEHDILVDTVPYGCFPASLFRRIGLFDEDLIRNQDDEFNGRIVKQGGKIYLIPELKIQYFARPNWKLLSRMFYQYGLFKPLVNMKLGSPATARQMAPPLFVLVTCLLLCMALFSHSGRVMFGIYGLIYGIATMLASIHAVKQARFETMIYTWLTFPVIHFSYGIGYIFGIIRFMLFRAHQRGKITMHSSR